MILRRPLRARNKQYSCHSSLSEEIPNFSDAIPGGMLRLRMNSLASSFCAQHDIAWPGDYKR